MANEPVDLAAKFSMFSEHWSPKVVARLNDYEMSTWAGSPVEHRLRQLVDAA